MKTIPESGIAGCSRLTANPQGHDTIQAANLTSKEPSTREVMPAACGATPIVGAEIATAVRSGSITGAPSPAVRAMGSSDPAKRGLGARRGGCAGISLAKSVGRRHAGPAMMPNALGF
ncbi:MAG: hypothetical protein WAN46_11965 [Gammaproteobacteria bacterium]